jgi:hypothetical protein
MRPVCEMSVTTSQRGIIRQSALLLRKLIPRIRTRQAHRGKIDIHDRSFIYVFINPHEKHWNAAFGRSG